MVEFRRGLNAMGLAESKRQADYMAAAHRRERARRQKRLARLTEAKEGLRAAKAAMVAIESREWLSIRREFVQADPPRTVFGPAVDDSPSPPENIDDRPPMTQLIHRRARTLPFYLAALWEAQVSTPPGVRHHNQRPRLRFGRGWDTLIGDQGLDKRNRHLRSQRILEALYRRRLVGLPPPRTPHRYDEFELLKEDQSGDPYSVPVDEDVIFVPSAFIANGWHLVLEPTESACFLMLLDWAFQHPAAHSNEGVGIIDRLRRSLYGVTPEVYEVHNELAEFGLLQVTDSVAGRRRGRVAPETLDADLVTFQFKVQLGALQQDALDVVEARLSDPEGGRVSTDSLDPFS